MTFVTVDNDVSRLEILTILLKEAFPHCVVKAFTDPLMSAQYIINNEVDAVLAAEQMRPADGENLRYIIEVNKPAVKVFLLHQSPKQKPSQNEELFPVIKEQLTKLMAE